MDDWQLPEFAPKGRITDSISWRAESEYFIGQLKDGSVKRIRRLPEMWSYTWGDEDETYYAKDWLVGWKELPVQGGQ